MKSTSIQEERDTDTVIYICIDSGSPHTVSVAVCSGDVINDCIPQNQSQCHIHSESTQDGYDSNHSSCDSISEFSSYYI